MLSHLYTEVRQGLRRYNEGLVVLMIRKPGGAWHMPPITAYPNEEALKMLLAQSPELLPVEQGGKMVVATEVAVPDIGYIDLVGVDPDGNITLVECKLGSNTEIKRKVVGQIFAYAAGLWKMSYEGFDQAFAAKHGAPLARAMADLDPEAWDEENFRLNVADNLARGRFRLIIAVDKITDELRQIVLYLNQHTVAEVQFMALELGYIADEGVEIVLPTTYGEESIQEKVATEAQTRKWNEASMFEALAARCTPPVVQVMRALYDFARERQAELRFGTTIVPSLTVRLPIADTYVSTFNLTEWPPAKGCLVVYLGALRDSGIAEAVMTAFTERLLAIQGLTFTAKKSPSIVVDGVLTQPGALDTMKEALDMLIQSPLRDASAACGTGG